MDEPPIKSRRDARRGMLGTIFGCKRGKGCSAVCCEWRVELRVQDHWMTAAPDGIFSRAFRFWWRRSR